MKLDFLSLALSMARKSTSKYRLGAVVVKKNRVISTGFNQMSKTHPVMLKYNRDYDYEPRLHAEIHACLGVSVEDLLGSDVYVGRLYRNDSQALAKPCLVCQRFLRNVGIKSVHYSTALSYETIKL